MGFSLKKIFGGGGSVPQFDTRPGTDLLNKSAGKQVDFTQNLFDRSKPINENFANKNTQLGNEFLDTTKQMGSDYTNSLNNPALRDQAVGRINENAFRNVPSAQNMIKESLAGTGRYGSGRATDLLAQPVLQAAQQAGDQATEFDVNQDAIRQGALRDVYNTNTGAAGTKFGSDTGTNLTKTGFDRFDLGQYYGDQGDIENNLSQGLFNLDVTKQNANIAAAQAKSAQRSALLQSILGIGGQIAGGYAGGLAGKAAAVKAS